LGLQRVQVSGGATASGVALRPGADLIDLKALNTSVMTLDHIAPRSLRA
jgi:hypothetical protein